MPWLNVVLFLYGLLDIAMGYLGYQSKGSIVSLIAGVVCGLVVLFSILLYRSHPRNSRITALVVTCLMMGNFAKGTFADNKIYPAGIMFAASFVVAACLLIGHVMGMKARKAREAAEKQ